MKHLEETDNLFDIFERHYPNLVEGYKGKDGKQKTSVFSPTLGDADWQNEIKEGVIPKNITGVWEETKKVNEKFFSEVEKENEDYYKNLKSNSSPPVSLQNIYIFISVCFFFGSVLLHRFFSDNEALRKLGVRKLWPINFDIHRELAYSNCRHLDPINRGSRMKKNCDEILFVSPIISIG